MDLLFDIIQKDFPLTLLFDFLIGNRNVQDLGQWISIDENTRRIFPQLLTNFIRQQTAVFSNQQRASLSKDLQPKPAAVKSASPRLSPATEYVNTRKFRTKDIQLNFRDDSNFPALGASEVNVKRRINPTHLGPAQQSSPLQTLSPEADHSGKRNPFSQVKETTVRCNFDSERALLREKKSKQQSRPKPTTLHDFIVQKETVTSPAPVVEAQRSCVTQQAALDRLVELFTFCLDRSLLHLFSEISLVFEVFLIRTHYTEPLTANKPFESVHNCVYFATEVLRSSKYVLDYLDCTTVKLLSENPRLVQFAPDFAKYLVTRAHELNEEPRRGSRHVASINVAFQPETDDRSNFSSDASFHAFRKQRDSFCAIWQSWKQNNSAPQWSTPSALGSSIRKLIELKSDCVNLMHLARLFRCQLLDVAQLNEESSNALPELLNSDPEKLRRLQQRLISPPERTTRGDFEGDLEFFRDFILLGNSSAFNEAVKLDFLNTILELNQKEFDSVDDTHLTTREFVFTVISLKTLAKFLGFLVFRPYSCTDQLPENVFHKLAELRRRETPYFDVASTLADAVHAGRLVLTLPWVVSFLSQADAVSLSLPAYQSASESLVYVYRKATGSRNPATRLLIQLLLSWFFEQPQFPAQILRKDPEHHPSTNRLQSLDSLPLVDSSLLNQCCPFLSSWRAALIDFNSGLRSQQRVSSVRKITPISTSIDNKASAVKSIEELLEENFFHNQSPSVKKTVDFVSERFASNVVRKIRSHAIPLCLDNAQRVVKDWPLDDAVHVEERIDKLCVEFCRVVADESRKLIDAELNPLKTNLTVLLPADLLQESRNVCVAIATRLIRDKVNKWVEAHVTVDFFRNDVEAEVKKLIKSTNKGEAEKVLPKAPNSQCHDAAVVSPSLMLDRLKRTLRDVLDDSLQLSRPQMVELIDQLRLTLTSRADVSPQVFRFFQQLTFDLLLTACAFQPEVIDVQVLEHFVRYWVQFHSGIKHPEETPYQWMVFVPKHLLLMAQTTQARLSWDQVTNLVIRLLKEELLTFSDFEEQAVAVLQQQWPKELLERFATCLRDVVDWQRPKLDPSKNEDVAVELVDWLSWFCTTTE